MSQISVRDVPRVECDEIYVGPVLVASVYRHEALPMPKIREAIRRAVRTVLEETLPEALP